MAATSRARLGLGQGERDEVLAARQLREPAGLLLVGAREGDRQRAQLLDREDQAGRGARPAELFDREADAQQLPAEAAVLLREREREDVVVGQELAEVLGELGGPVDVGRARGHPLVREHADGVAEHLVLLREAERPGGAVRGGHRAHRTAHRTGVGHVPWGVVGLR